MSKVKDKKKKIKAKLEAIKKINDNPKKATDDLFDAYLKDLPSTDKLFGNKLDSFLEKRKRKKENKKDIFSELMDIAEGFLGSNNSNVAGSDKLFSKGKIKKYAIDSCRITLENAKPIILESVKKVFFEGEGICGANSDMSIDTITIKPKEIDFLNMLTLDPSSSSGKIMYEPQGSSVGKQKVNRSLYDSFNSGPYQFDTNNNLTLFTSTWDSGSQQFNISGLTQGGLNPVKVEDFFNDYYSNIELPDITGITKTAMLMTIQGDGGESVLFKDGMKNLNRLLQKLFALCNSETNRNSVANQNAVDLFDENDEVLEFYFDFNDVEGIDLDDEDAISRGVLKFRDCDNFEIPVNTDNIEDFVYLSSTSNNINNVVDDTLRKAAKDAAEQSDLPLINLNLSLLNTFILQLPKALIGSLLSPKIFLPIVIIYKLFKSALAQLDVKELMRKLSKLFGVIVKQLFWRFLREFWQFIKRDLIIFLRKLVAKILKNKYRRYVTIVKSLINFLSRLRTIPNFDNCSTLFEAITAAIEASLAGTKSFNLPGILLGLSDTVSPGYSQDRALLNITERLEKAGVPMGPLYGDSNKLVDVIKGIVDGHTEEMDTNGFVKVSNKKMTIPTPVGPIVIPPGILNSSGKII
jgi:hypothetical protein